MRLLSTLALVFTLFATGCIVAPDSDPYPYPNGGGTVPPAPRPLPPAPPVADAPVALGALGMPGYRILANAFASMPAGDLGFMVTANGQGGYRVTWTDTLGSAAHFAGSITSDGLFDPASVVGFSGAESIALSRDARVITFDSTPGTYVDGVDLVSTADPIYLDLQVDGQRAGFSIYFTGAQSGAQLNAAYDPVAFTSP